MLTIKPSNFSFPIFKEIPTFLNKAIKFYSLYDLFKITNIL